MELTEINNISDIVFWNIILLLMASIFVNLYLINVRAQDKRRKQANNNSFPKQLKRFLYEQGKSTIDVKQQPKRHQLEKHISKLRSAYLKIEEKAVDKGINSAYYWAYLGAQIERLFDIIADSKALTPISEMKHKIKAIKDELASLPQSQNTETIRNGIDKIYQSCTKPPHDIEKVVRYNSKLDDIFKRMCSSRYRNVASHLDKQLKQVDKCQYTSERLQQESKQLADALLSVPEKNIGKYTQEIGRLKEKSKEMTSSADILDKNLSSVKKSISDNSNIIITINNDENIGEKISHDASFVDDLLEESEKEISRLKDVVSHQKNTIIELEENLFRLEDSEEKTVDEGEVKLLRMELQTLQKNLHESEQCVHILENELENLRELMDTSTVLDEIENKSTADDILNEEDMLDLKDQIEDLHTQLHQEVDEHNRLSDILNYVKEAFKSNSIEDIALLIYQTLLDMGYAISVLVYVDGRTIELSKSGKISPKEKLLINNMQAYEINLSSDALRITLKMPNIGGSVYSSRLKQLSEKDQEYLISFFEISDKILADVKSSRNNNHKKRNLDDVTNKIKIATNDIDHTLEETLSRIKNEVAMNFAQVQDLMRTKGLSASQIARIKSYEKNAITEIESESLTRLKLKKKLLDIIMSLENIEST